MIPVLKISGTVLFLPLIMLIYSGCGCSCGQNEAADIPSSVVKNADQVIIAHTGEDFFQKYITIDFRRSKNISPDYFLVYRMIVPDKPYINETIEFTVDKNGNLNKEFVVKGIPDCTNGNCGFNIDEANALSIAENNGLKKGIKNPEASFVWNEKFNKYVWEVSSVESASPNSQGGTSSGRLIIIDPASGNVLGNNDWHVR